MRDVIPAATLALLLTADLSPAAAADEYRPGVVVSVFEVEGGLRSLPELPPGQLPSSVRIAATIDFGEAGEPFGGASDNFVTLVTGYIEVPAAATYKFRLISDDGARLWVAGRLVVDHDGLHAAEPRDGEIALSAGRHPLRILHFEAGGSERLLLQWRSLIAAAIDAFETVPATALWHDASASLAAEPGIKRVIAPQRRGRPGDGTPVAGLHPSLSGEPIDVSGLRTSASIERRVDDRLLLCASGDPPDAPGADAPFAWLPPSADATRAVSPTRVPSGVYADQILVGENPGGSLWRVFPDGQDAEVQGCVFRFSSGLPDPIGAITWDAGGRLLVGRADGQQFVRLTPTGRTPFEMLAIRALANGFEIEFTAPLAPEIGWEAETYQIERWPYGLSGVRSGPVRDGSTIPVNSASVSEDRRKVFLELPDLQPGAVYYIRLLPPCLSQDAELPWSTEAWYTLRHAPAGRRGVVRTPPPGAPQNVLTDRERAEGWRLLFDGRTTDGWRGFNRPDCPTGWQVRDGCLVRVAPAGDIITAEQFENFELSLEWRISPGGNSGIFYRVLEGPEFKYVWQTGPEMQVLDNTEHKDGRNAVTSAGANYALHAPTRDATRPVGLFNLARIVVNGAHVEHWLNGEKIVEYELGSPEWERLVAASKFAAMPQYGRARKGHIALQDHGDKVWYRNIKIRELP